MTTGRRLLQAAAAVLLVILGRPTLAFACSCAWGGPFTRVALGQEVVVLGRVVDHRGNSMGVRVIEGIKGNAGGRTIRVWGDNGALCRPYVSSFPVGSTWILAVSPTASPEGAWWTRFLTGRRERAYAISICGDFWLEVRGDRAVGRITAGTPSGRLEWVPLKDMLSWIRASGTGPGLFPTPLSRSGR